MLLAQNQALLPLLAEPPGSWPAEQLGEADATLTWRGQQQPGSDSTLEAALLAVLQFVAGALSSDFRSGTLGSSNLCRTF